MEAIASLCFIAKWYTTLWKEKFQMWFAHRMPRWLVYFCLIRGWAYATTGKFSKDDAVSIRMDDVVERWNGRNH